MGLEAVFFDLDNTLIDYAGYKLRTATAAAEELVRRGFPDTVENIVMKIFDVYDRHGMEYQKTMYAVIVQYCLKMREAEMFQQAAIIEYNRAKFAGIPPYPEAHGVLSELRKMRLKLAIVTDGPRNKVFQRLLLARMENSLDLVVTNDDTMQAKPHRAPFRFALKRLHVKAQNAMMVGDLMGRDMEGAHRLGMLTCHAVYGDTDRRVNERKGGMVKKELATSVVPNFRINRLKELPPIVAGLMK